MSDLENTTVENPIFVSISIKDLDISFNCNQSDKQLVEHVMVEYFNEIDVKKFNNMNPIEKFDEVCKLFSQKIGVGIPYFKKLDFKKSQITEKLDIPENLDRKPAIEKLLKELFENKDDKKKKKDISKDGKCVADKNNETSCYSNFVQKNNEDENNEDENNEDENNNDEQKINTNNEDSNDDMTVATNDSHNIKEDENRSIIENNELKSNDFGVQIFRNKHGTVDIVSYYNEARCQKKNWIMENIPFMSLLGRMFRSDVDINLNFKQYTFTITSKKVSQIERKLSNKVSENNIQPNIE
jgi:hypothetical protein